MNRREAIVAIGCLAAVPLLPELVQAKPNTEQLLAEIDQFQFIFKPFQVDAFEIRATLGWKGYIHKAGCGGLVIHKGSYVSTVARDSSVVANRSFEYKCRACHCNCQYGDFVALPVNEEWTEEKAIDSFGSALQGIEIIW
jgi:hypothetical protein